MSWFYYGDQPIRRYRKGVFLRVRNLPDGIMDQVNKVLTKGQTLYHVKVAELKPDKQVLLEFWMQPRRIAMKPYPIHVYEVFYLTVPENPMWVCESDVGRGLVVPGDKNSERRRRLRYT